MTGFGKTGTNFASEQLTHQPDIMCLSKALTAGLVPMGITSCSQKIYQAFLSNEIAKGFFHGHTYSANPIACAVATKAIKLLASEKIQNNIKEIIASHSSFAEKISKHSNAKNIRHKGVILALDPNIEMDRYGNLRDELFQFFMQRGVFLRPLGNTIYLLPPYVITQRELQTVYKTIQEALEVFV